MDDTQKLHTPFLPTSPQTPKKVAVLKPSVEPKKKWRSSIIRSKDTGIRNTKKPVLDQLFEVKSRGLEIEKPGKRKIKSLVYTILNPRSRQLPAICFKWFISSIIVVDFIFFVISTEPAYRDKQYDIFRIEEIITSSIFLGEYLARLYTITENKKYGDLGPFWGRLSFAIKFSSLVDLFATLPCFLELSTGWELPTLTYLRTFRLLRILKASGFVQATDAVWRVIYYNRAILWVAVFVGLFMILTTSTLMFYLRPGKNYKSDGKFHTARSVFLSGPKAVAALISHGIPLQPISLVLSSSNFPLLDVIIVTFCEEFESILSTMYLSTLMLTGQGLDLPDLPWYTKGVVLITSAFSIGMFAIPVSMLTWGFEAEAERCAKRSRQLEKRRMSRENSSYDGSSTEDYSTDEEYQKIIAGEDTDDEVDDATKGAIKLFLQADVDGSGSLSLKEYLELSRLNHPVREATGQEGTLGAQLDALEKKVDDIAEKVNRLCDALAPPMTIK
jgi:hypothetical protein